MTKRYTIALKDEEAEKVDSILASKGMSMTQAVRKMFKLQEARTLDWKPWAHRKVCQPGAEGLDTQPTPEQDAELD